MRNCSLLAIIVGSLYTIDGAIVLRPDPALTSRMLDFQADCPFREDMIAKVSKATK
jgi:hypothetical protein